MSIPIYWLSQTTIIVVARLSEPLGYLQTIESAMLVGDMYVVCDQVDSHMAGGRWSTYFHM